MWQHIWSSIRRLFGLEMKQAASFNRAIPVILKHEGGYSDHDDDPGGPTQYGISLDFLMHLGQPFGDINDDMNINKQDIKSLSRKQAKALYKRFFWDKYGYGLIQYQTIATKLFDLAVNMGPKRGCMLLQQAINRNLSGEHIAVDGLLGSQTLSALERLDPNVVLTSFKACAEHYYRNLIADHPSLEVFKQGWMRRAKWPDV